MRRLRIVYAGTPEFAVPALKALITAGHDVTAVYTQPDRRSGRGRQLKYSPVKSAAIDMGIPVEQPSSLKDEGTLETLAHYDPDVIVVAAYGLMLPRPALELPLYGCLNIHASLLPRWRGAAPIQRAIEAGDRETGISIMKMEMGLDTGSVLLRRIIPILPEDTGGSLHERLAHLGAHAIVDALEDVTAYLKKAEPQDEVLACYARKLSKDESLINWRCSADKITRKIQAFNPWPVAETHWLGRSLKLLEALTLVYQGDAPIGRVIGEGRDGIDVVAGEDLVRILRLQLPGRRSQTAAEFINGRSLLGQTFSR